MPKKYTVHGLENVWYVRHESGRRASEIFDTRREAQDDCDRLEKEAHEQTHKPRKCMCCGMRFVSEGIHNRLCVDCRRRPSMGSFELHAN